VSRLPVPTNNESEGSGKWQESERSKRLFVAGIKDGLVSVMVMECRPCMHIELCFRPAFISSFDRDAVTEIYMGIVMGKRCVGEVVDVLCR